MLDVCIWNDKQSYMYMAQYYGQWVAVPSTAILFYIPQRTNTFACTCAFFGRFKLRDKQNGKAVRTGGRLDLPEHDINKILAESFGVWRIN